MPISQSQRVGLRITLISVLERVCVPSQRETLKGPLCHASVIVIINSCCSVYKVASRILTVGDPARALRLSRLLDSVRFTHHSARGFSTYTGLLNGMQISIVAIGMGTPVMDMFLREARFITSGPLTVIRFGSCGGIGEQTHVGQVLVANAAINIQRNFDSFSLVAPSKEPPYRISRPVFATKSLTELLHSNLTLGLGQEAVGKGWNATADSFYSSQGLHFLSTLHLLLTNSTSGACKYRPTGYEFPR